MTTQALYPNIKPSMLLDFQNTKQLDPRITYTRASTATYYDGVTTAKAEENLFTYSQDFSNAAWTKAGTTITANSTTAPDGTTTASTVTASGGSIVNRVAQTSISGTFMFSFYAKANTQNFIQLNQNASSNYFANFDLSTGTVGTVGASTVATITSVGNSWYRCTMTVTSATLGVLGLYVIDSSTAAAFATTTSTSNFYVWGAQLEQRSAVTSYTTTTTQTITNYIPQLLTAASGIARFDHNPITDESLGLLIEESRTNLFTYSEQFDNGNWSKGTGGSIFANSVVAPNGTLTADVYTWPTTTSSYGYLSQTVSGNPTNAYTYSVWIKRPLGSSSVSLRLVVSDYTVSTGNSSNITVTDAWQRFTFTRTSATNTGNVGAGFNTAAASPPVTAIAAGDIIHVWGAQLEAGAFATSYIPTVASQVTRSADEANITGTNFSSWYNPGEGTLYGEGATNDDSYPTLVSINNGSTAQVIELQGSSTAVNLNFIVVSTTVQASIAATLTKSGSKCIGVYKTNDFASSVNASSVMTDTSGSIPIVDRMTIGAEISSFQWNGTIKKIAYYPFRVSNTNLQALTS